MSEVSGFCVVGFVLWVVGCVLWVVGFWAVGFFFFFFIGFRYGLDEWKVSCLNI